MYISIILIEEYYTICYNSVYEKGVEMARKGLGKVMQLVKTVNNELPVETSFLNDLKRTIELEEKKNLRKPSQAYKPSSMNCIRCMYYQVIGQEPDASESSYCLVGICNSGSDIHVRIQTAVEAMKNNDIDCEYIDVAEFVKQRGLTDIEIVSKQGMETKLYHKKYNMSFLCDGIIKYKGRYYILELKTESIYKWQSRKFVDEKHFNQATAYSLAFGLDKVVFIYINRDLLDMKAFMLEVTDDMRMDLVGKISNCDEYVKQLKVPPKPDIDKKQCTYCVYKNRCNKE